MKNKKLIIPKSSKGYGFCGTWLDETIGWNIPNHLSNVAHLKRRYSSEKPYERSLEYIQDDHRFYLCEITIKPIKDKLGRPITRLFKSLKDK